MNIQKMSCFVSILDDSELSSKISDCNCKVVLGSSTVYEGKVSDLKEAINEMDANILGMCIVEVMLSNGTSMVTTLAENENISKMREMLDGRDITKLPDDAKAFNKLMIMATMVPMIPGIVDEEAISGTMLGDLINRYGESFKKICAISQIDEKRQPKFCIDYMTEDGYYDKMLTDDWKKSLQEIGGAKLHYWAVSRMESSNFSELDSLVAWHADDKGTGYWKNVHDNSTNPNDRPKWATILKPNELKKLESLRK